VTQSLIVSDAITPSERRNREKGPHDPPPLGVIHKEKGGIVLLLAFFLLTLPLQEKTTYLFLILSS
jgi:hypothetical protein